MRTTRSPDGSAGFGALGTAMSGSGAWSLGAVPEPSPSPNASASPAVSTARGVGETGPAPAMPVMPVAIGEATARAAATRVAIHEARRECGDVIPLHRPVTPTP